MPFLVFLSCSSLRDMFAYFFDVISPQFTLNLYIFNILVLNPSMLKLGFILYHCHINKFTGFICNKDIETILKMNMFNHVATANRYPPKWLDILLIVCKCNCMLI